jgi:hypothetical protein
MHKCNWKAIIALLTVFIFAGNSFSASPPKEQWQAVITCNGFKFKGVLKNVTDSSVIIAVRGKETDEFLFRDMDKIKLRPLHGEPGKRLVGFFAAGITGGVITGMAVSAGRTGEPAALAGVVTGIGSGLLFGLTGTLLAPQVSNLFATRKIIVQHNSTFYVLLRQKLSAYCPCRQAQD